MGTVASSAPFTQGEAPQLRRKSRREMREPSDSRTAFNARKLSGPRNTSELVGRRMLLRASLATETLLVDPPLSTARSRGAESGRLKPTCASVIKVLSLGDRRILPKYNSVIRNRTGLLLITERLLQYAAVLYRGSMCPSYLNYLLLSYITVLCRFRAPRFQHLSMLQPVESTFGSPRRSTITLGNWKHSRCVCVRMSLWPDSKTPDLLDPAPRAVKPRGIFQKITSQLWGGHRPRTAMVDLAAKHDALWRLLHETDRWFEALHSWDTEVSVDIRDSYSSNTGDCFADPHRLLTLLQGLYRVPGSSVEIDRLFKSWSDGTITALPADASPYSISSLLKRGFRDLALIEPVIPFNFYEQFLDIAAISARDESTAVHYLGELLRSLPSRNRSLLGALLKHLRTVSRHAQQNKMTTYNLAVSWAPNVIFPKEVTFRTLHEAPQAVRVFQVMLDHGAQLLIEEASVGAVGSGCSPSAVPPVLGAALQWIETTPLIAADPNLYIDLEATQCITARDIKVQSCIDGLKHRCQAGSMPDFGALPSDIAAAAVSQLVLRFLAEAPQQLVPHSVIPALVNCLPLVSTSAPAAPSSESRSRRSPSREFHFLISGSSGGSEPPLTPRHHASLSSIPISMSSRTLTTHARRASESRSTRAQAPLPPLAPERVAPIGSADITLMQTPITAPPACDAEDAARDGESDDRVAIEHQRAVVAALVSIDPTDPAVDALRDCVQSLSLQSQNILARLCAHAHAIAALQASQRGEPFSAALSVVAERLVGAVFRPQRRGDSTPGAVMATVPAAAAATAAAQPRILLQVLALLIAFQRHVFGERSVDVCVCVCVCGGGGMCGVGRHCSLK
jgi:hypothetical protein